MHAAVHRLAENDHRVLGELVESLGVHEGERRHGDDHADLEALLCPERDALAPCHGPQEVRPSREHPLDLQVDGRIAEPAGELQRIDPSGVGDAVDVDVAGITRGRQPVLHLEERLLEEGAGAVPEARGAHLPGLGADVVVEHPLVLEVHEDGLEELLPIEESADRHFHAGGVLLQLEVLDLAAPAVFVVLQHGEDVQAVLLLSHEGENLLVLRPAAGLHDVAPGVCCDERDGRVE